MSKTGDTKRKIVEMLEEKNGTLTDISKKLGLAPSTVSQHLQEMIDEGIIKPVDGRPRKWKYYEINRNAHYSNQNRDSQLPIKRWRYALPIAVVAVLLVIAGVFYTYTNTQNVSAQQVYLAPGSSVPIGSTLFTVSDAPTSYNISALYVTVDNASIHSTTGKWYKIPLQVKSFDLIALDNISKVLSGISLGNGTYNEIILQISNVTATVNGTNQSVYLPNHKLSIFGRFNISNGTTNWINIDFNLENSLHITKNGKIVMLPVLFIRHINDNSLDVNDSTIVIARGDGRVREMFEEGMEVNGNMISNYTASQNVSIAALADGRFNENGTENAPIIIRGDHGLFIGGDAAAFLNISNYTNVTTANLISVGRCSSAYINENVGPANQVIVARRCCMVAGSGTNALTEINNSNASATASANISGCCFFGATSNGQSLVALRVCHPRQVGGAVPIPISVGADISRDQLNNGMYIRAWATNAAVPYGINISVPSSSGGNFSTEANCELENGALQCHSYHHVDIADIRGIISTGVGAGLNKTNLSIIGGR